MYGVAQSQTRLKRLSSSSRDYRVVAQTVKDPPAMWETWVRPLDQEDPPRRKWQPTPVLLAGELHEQRSLKVYNPWGGKESDTTKLLSLSGTVGLLHP